MTEAATFFRNRETDPGRTYQFEIEGLSKQRATVYTCTPVEPESRRLVLKDLNALVSNAGGGLIVTSSDDNGGRFLTVRAVAATGYVP
ncbi:MAG: hypothetical protein JOZ54_25285, partial [Acidobacteria bacterium]|nr:hypothetical protein [Acidobacteriota bacterium]